MSVIVELPNGEIELLMKGADSIVEKRLKPGQPTLSKTKQYL
jgi:magnesium-transporting ATPase (P-type)